MSKYRGIKCESTPVQTLISLLPCTRSHVYITYTSDYNNTRGLTAYLARGGFESIGLVDKEIRRRINEEKADKMRKRRQSI
jgi:hypothetical protein